MPNPGSPAGVQRLTTHEWKIRNNKIVKFTNSTNKKEVPNLDHWVQAPRRFLKVVRTMSGTRGKLAATLRNLIRQAKTQFTRDQQQELLTDNSLTLEGVFIKIPSRWLLK